MNKKIVFIFLALLLVLAIGLGIYLATISGGITINDLHGAWPNFR